MFKRSRVIFAAAFAVGMSFVSFGEIINPAAFDYTIEYKVSGYSGTTTVTDLPILVRLKNDVPSGFDYADCPQDSIRFTDGKGNLIPHEVDTWNASGESLIWVKVPSVAGQETAFAMYYGSERVKPVALAPSEVWTNYRGVWHLNESGGDGGTTDPVVVVNATSLGADLNGEAYGGTVGVAGKIGGGRRISDSTDTKNALGGIWVDGSKNCADVGSKLTISGWMIHRDQAYYYDHVFYRREASESSNGGIAIEINNTDNVVAVRGNGKTLAKIGIPSAVKTDWTYLSFVYNEKTATVYANGEKTGSGSIGAATDNDLLWVFGNDTDGYKGAAGDISWKGSMDEIRLSAVAQTDDYAKAEYQAMGEDFLTAGEVVPLDATAPVFETPVVQVASDGSATMTFTVTDGEGEVSALVGGEKTYVGAIGTDITLNEPKTVDITIDENACVEVGVYGINTKGTEVTKFATGAAMNAAVEAVVTNDANERGLIPGVFTVSRPNGVATDLPIIVNLSWEGGSAVQGKNYLGELPASVTIPAGATSTTVVVTPLRDAESDNDETIILKVAAGAYKSGATATMKILNLVTDPNYNTWVAVADGLASDAANWSKGVPQSGDKILFDPQFSTANCEWDGGVKGLSTSVAEWTQTEGYTGTVTFDTTYTGAFTVLAVAGNVTVNGGSWTHQRGEVNNSTPTYRLKVVVGGAFTLGAAAKVDLKAKGFAGGQKPSGSSAGSHASSCDGYSMVYGNVYAPDMPGSGSNGSNSWGGGAFWLEVAGAATIDGTITVRPYEQDNIKQPAAGSVYIKAASCGGAGHIYADYEVTSSYSGGGGSAGRVAIVLTEATEMAFPEANVAIKGRLSGGIHGGGGTFFYKTADQTNGTLVLDDVREKNYSVRWHKPTQITAIPAGETWTFDAIKIKRYGMLAIPEGTTLNLPNGPQSVSASSTRQGGLLYQGGTINWGSAPYVFSGNWIFQPNVPYAFNGDVTIADKGAIGCMIYQGSTDFSDAAKCEFTVNGTLTIDQGGAIYAKGGGPDQPVSRNSYAAHGGATMNAACLDTVYDSIFDPAYPGYTAADGDQATTRSGGGLVKVTVNGDLVVNGTINAEGWLNGDIGAAGSGGTINIVAHTLSGEGSMTVDATRESRWTYYNIGGAGRIAVRLTDGVFSDYWKSHITAKGRSWYDSSKSSEHGASAGTVYLQEKGVAEKAGEIIVRNDNVDDEHKPYTYLPVTSTKTPTDEIDDFKHARMTLLDKALVKLSTNTEFKMRELEVDSGSTLDICGNTLTVRSAKLGDTNLAAGTYAAGDVALGDFVSDSVGGGSLVVTGGSNSGLVIFFR